MNKGLMIGEIAAATGAKVNTIRFYEDIGLMPRAARTASGRRVYDESDSKRLSFIRHGRALGFSIDEIRSLIDLWSHPDRECADAAAIACQHLRNVEERIEQLEVLRAKLTKIAGSCEGGRTAECGVIEAIAER